VGHRRSQAAVVSRTFRVRRTPKRPSAARDQLLLLLLAELWVLNIADLALTRYGIWLGFATESNGVMDYFLRAGTLPTLLFKVGIVSLGALLLWRLRQYTVATVAAALVALVFAAVVAYQVFWVLSLR
jgi:hypothetical protein